MRNRKVPRCLLAVIASCINLIFHTPALSNTPVYGDNVGVLPRCLIFFGGGERGWGLFFDTDQKCDTKLRSPHSRSHRPVWHKELEICQSVVMRFKVQMCACLLQQCGSAECIRHLVMCICVKRDIFFLWPWTLTYEPTNFKYCDRYQDQRSCRCWDARTHTHTPYGLL